MIYKVEVLAKIECNIEAKDIGEATVIFADKIKLAEKGGLMNIIVHGEYKMFQHKEEGM